MGGETLDCSCWAAAMDGLSPRGRGNRQQVMLEVAACGSIPAWAGKPGTATHPQCTSTVYPRVGGETWAFRASMICMLGLSPRGRGNRIACLAQILKTGSIPAWAGKPYCLPRANSQDGVYPRVGGETVLLASRKFSRRGLSPRGRGNPVVLPERDDLARSIPAWAGKPVRSAGRR